MYQNPPVCLAVVRAPASQQRDKLGILMTEVMTRYALLQTLVLDVSKMAV